jgi:hypothetical protein
LLSPFALAIHRVWKLPKLSPVCLSIFFDL